METSTTRGEPTRSALRTPITAFVLMASTVIARSDTEPKRLIEPDILAVVQSIRDQKLQKLSLPLVVEGEQSINAWFIVADRIVFKKGAKLIFSNASRSQHQPFEIIANDVVSEDPTSPGMITFEKADALPAPAVEGQAPGGASGTYDGDSGSPGAAGEAGNLGASGQAAPKLVLAVKQLDGGLIVDLTGGKGGQGGKGQKGGDGGAGAKGSPASQSMFDCKAGGGKGGNGGRGGNGGAGGSGGDGGEGGTVTLLSATDQLQPGTLRIIVDGGVGGAGGDGGPGGNPGPGGPGGQEAEPYCRGGASGAMGAPGGPGARGSTGNQGKHGSYLIGSISVDRFNMLNQ